MQSKHTNVAIIGGSFAGLSALLKLRRRLGKKISITLFDQRENFTYIPALHEGLYESSERIKKMQFSLKKYYPEEFIHVKVKQINEQSLITEDNTKRTFDYTIIATGSRTNFFGNKKREQNAEAVRYAEDIPRINKKLQTAKNIVVIGGGFTGVEVASIIAQKKSDDISLTLIHSKDRLFDRLSENISRLCHTRLTKHNNVSIHYNDRVQDIEKNSVLLQSGKALPSDLTIVSRGIQTNDETFNPQLTFKGQYQSLESKSIFMCGDVAKHGLYTTAHNAMMEGRRIADIIADMITGIENEYPPLSNWDKLAIALGTKDGILTNGKKGITFPWFTGIAKRVIEQRVLAEFKWKIMFRI